ncbi:MAG: hypothetical protein HYX47_18700 [Burkholderiales bacterium]|nr:hypothetical protein [Burkholderiales bacterium]
MNQYESSHPALTIELLRRYTLILLHECKGGSANLLRASVAAARTNADILKLRSAMFECMSAQLGEAEAMERIRSIDASA